MKVPPEKIQRLLRWATPESLKHYALLDADEYSDLMDVAQRTSFSITQVANMPALDNDEQHAAMAEVSQDCLDGHERESSRK